MAHFKNKVPLTLKKKSLDLPEKSRNRNKYSSTVLSKCVDIKYECATLNGSPECKLTTNEIKHVAVRCKESKMSIQINKPYTHRKLDNPNVSTHLK